jgi:nucleotide-binding universal stress UspA family protein
MTEQRLVPGNPVVVGVDGSEHSLAAADLAADEAARRGLRLELVHGFVPPAPSPAATMAPDLPPIGAAPELTEEMLRERAALRGQAERLLHEVAARVRADHPELPVVTRLWDGYPAGVLAEASRHAALMVVGHRGAGGFAGLLTGSVGVQLAEHSACPVIIVRGEQAADAPVVVGVDGSEGSRRAAEFAAEAAEWYQTSLIVLYAWVGDAGWPPAMAQSGRPPPAVPDAVTQVVTELTDKHPQIGVHPEVRQHLPAHEALVAASKHARLVVVGSRGLGGFLGLLLGSVSQALVHHAHCPVAVYPRVE